MVILKPGEFHFGDSGDQIRTLLGSCVAVTLWHPKLFIGGMCHYLLPHSPAANLNQLDGRYADHAVALFLRHVRSHNTQPSSYEVKIFGGGNMFPNLAPQGNYVGKRNIEAADRLLAEAGFQVRDRHVGMSGHRTIILDLATGHTWVRWQKS